MYCTDCVWGIVTDNDPLIQEWMKELDGHDIPDITPTQDGSCAGDPAAAAQAEERGWWTCGGWTSGNDIVACPDKMTWGVSFDDGPAPYSEFSFSSILLLVTMAEC